MPSFNKSLKCVKNVIFDVDGLLLDTEIFYDQAYLNIMKSYGMNFHKADRMRIQGTNTDSIAKFFVDELGVPCTYEEFKSQKEAHMAPLLPQCKILPGIYIIAFFADTEIYYKKAISDIAESYGKVYTTKVMNKIVGTPQTETCKIAIREMNLPLGIEQFRSLFVKLSYSRMHNVPLLPGHQLFDILYT